MLALMTLSLLNFRAFSRSSSAQLFISRRFLTLGPRAKFECASRKLRSGPRGIWVCLSPINASIRIVMDAAWDELPAESKN